MRIVMLKPCRHEVRLFMRIWHPCGIIYADDSGKCRGAHLIKCTFHNSSCTQHKISELFSVFVYIDFAVLQRYILYFIGLN